MNTHTNTTILERFNIDTTNLEYPELDVPILSATQRQGDVLFRLLNEPRSDHGTEVPDTGILVVAGETTGGNSHILHNLNGTSHWAPTPNEDLIQGILTIPDGAAAVLIHTDEHNTLAFGPGVYEVRRQREFRGEWEMVAD